MFKRVIVLLFCLMMVFVATFGFVVGVVSVPTIYSYAEVIDDDSIYVPLRDPSDLVVGFQAYCASRDLTVEGSIADAVTTFTTGAFNSACNTLGINISELQAEIKAEYDQSGKPVKFLFNDTGVMAMNRIFAQFLQDNELEVGDEDVNKTVYSGRYFSDNNNNGCLCYIYQGTAVSPSNSDILARGSTYLYDWTNVRDIGTYPYRYDFTYKGHSYYWYITYSSRNGGSYSAVANNTSGGNVLYAATSSSNPTNRYKGQCTVAFNSTTEKLYMAVHYDMLDSSAANTLIIKTQLTDQDTTPTSIVLISNQINNNTYEGDTIINNEGDVIVEPDPVPPGGNDPGWDIGGGGGTATDGNGNTWNIQFPDFELPDLNIDWSINGLGEKFPFSIPFDLVALVTVLNAEPQAPRFQGTVNFGFTTWNYDINLQQFDSVAQACRIAELLLLVVGLILVTRSIIKG